MTHLVANTICQQTASGRDGALSAKADKGSLSPLPCEMSSLFSEYGPCGPFFLRVTMQDPISDHRAILAVSSNKFMILTSCQKLLHKTIHL